MKKYINKLLLLFAVTGFLSCKKYLEAKPDKTTGVATALEDAQKLLDNYGTFNSYFPALADQSDDNYWMDDDRYNALYQNDRKLYSWAADVLADYEWQGLYTAILNATTALETVEKVNKDAGNANQWNTLKGTALFQVAQYYAGIYDSATAAAKPGIPLRTNSDVLLKSERATMAESWEHIAASFKAAAELLPVTTIIKTRPNRAAAYAALARTYLTMNRFADALTAADDCLALNSSLLDLNTMDSNAAVPFTRFNEEVLFHCVASYAGALDAASYSLDSMLFAAYDVNDLRRAIYFTANSYGYGFKGMYSGDLYSGAFIGLAVDEVLLIKAECLARLAQADAAVHTLNELLVSRWKTGTFVPFTAASAASVLELVLEERRKELILRGTRWFDLRRLSNDAANSVEPKRHIEGVDIVLQPGSSLYTFLIPQKVIDLTEMEQNLR
jgi:hypothetical protein